MRVPKHDYPRSIKHRKWVASLPCLACCMKDYPALGLRGATVEAQSQAAHIRAGQKGGLSMRPGDEWVIPLCPTCHTAFDANQKHFWLAVAENVARRLAAMSPDEKIRKAA